MLRSVILVAAVANMAMAAVANICAQHPYQQMHHFRDYSPAKAHCAAHYPLHVVTKTIEPRCLTTTRREIIRTETVTVRRTSRCPTKYHTEPDSSMYPVPTHGHHHQPPNYGGHHHSPPNYGGHHHQPNGYGTYHHPEPVKYHHKRDAAPEPTPDPKNSKAHEWEKYHGDLKKCGYDCVQKACSCIATKKTVTHTPKPTCTKTIHTAGVHTETKTVQIQEICHHEQRFGHGGTHRYEGGGYGGHHHENHGYGEHHHENHGYGNHREYQGYGNHHESHGYGEHHENHSYGKHESYEKPHSYDRHH